MVKFTALTIYETEDIALLVSSQYKSVNLFNSKEFILHQNINQSKDTLAFRLESKGNNKILAELYFSRAKNGSEWFAPVTGAFSPIEFYKNVKIKDAEILIKQSVKYLKEKFNAKVVTWKLPPLYKENSNANKVINILYRSGWSFVSADLNYHFDIFSIESFRNGLNSTKRKELNRITRNNVSFCQSNNLEMHKKIYEMIAENRYSQGYPMTMSWDSVEKLYFAVRDKVKFFYIHRDDIMLASAICLSLSEDVMYVFYWGESPSFRYESPVVKLAEYLYEYCLINNYKVLDIGTSTEYSIPNQGLIDFKEKIGCIESSKFTMQIVI